MLDCKDLFYIQRLLSAGVFFVLTVSKINGGAKDMDKKIGDKNE